MDAPAALPASPPRSLLPQEHGAWGQLAMPLLSGLLLASPSAAGALVAVGAAAAFLAHEPWLVTLGHRGERARTNDGPRARRALAALAAVAAAAGGAGLWLAPRAARPAALLTGALAAVVVLLVVREAERTIPGELAVSTALASAGALVALASGAPSRTAASIFAAWALAFAATVLAVQTVLLRARSRGAADPGLLHAAATVAIVAAGSAAAVLCGLGWAVPLAVAPTAALSLFVCLARLPATRLRFLGWSLVVATSASLILLVVALRG